MKLQLVSGKHPLSIHVIWMPIVIGLMALNHFLPGNSCVFHNITGFPCLSCGATRAVDSLMDGDIIGMFYYNPLLVIFSAGLVFFSFLKLFEYILSFHLSVWVNKKSTLILRVFAITAIAANWLFLVVTGR